MTAAGATQTSATGTGEEAKPTLYCSFCGKSQFEVRKAHSGPTVFVCDEASPSASKFARTTMYRPKLETRDLSRRDTSNVAEIRRARDEQLRTSLHQMVDVLRKREVSWAVIGGGVGSLRQAAWDRFS